MEREFLFKVVIVGDGGVGKSTMIKRLTTGRFIHDILTIGTDLASYEFTLKGTKISLQLWDFAGEQRFRFFLPKYATDAFGCLICYDITRFSSFKNLTEWYDIVHDSSPKSVFMLIGEKLDLAKEKRVVNAKEAKKFQKKYDIPQFFETSSKSGENNKILFEKLALEILKKNKIQI